MQIVTWLGGCQQGAVSCSKLPTSALCFRLHLDSSPAAWKNWRRKIQCLWIRPPWPTFPNIQTWYWIDPLATLSNMHPRLQNLKFGNTWAFDIHQVFQILCNTGNPCFPPKKITGWPPARAASTGALAPTWHNRTNWELLVAIAFCKVDIHTFLMVWTRGRTNVK